MLCGWLQPLSVPTDADLMRLSDTARDSYILFERDHKSLVCIVFGLHAVWLDRFFTLTRKHSWSSNLHQE